jgi:hypothetical protein
MLAFAVILIYVKYMASITINPIVNRVPATESVTGEEKLLIINKDGKTSTIAVN